jgi:hypothetical protein
LDPSTAWQSKLTGSKFAFQPFGSTVLIDAVNRSFGFVNFKNLSDAVRAKREMEGKPLATSIKLSIQFTKVSYLPWLSSLLLFPNNYYSANLHASSSSSPSFPPPHSLSLLSFHSSMLRSMRAAVTMVGLSGE